MPSSKTFIVRNPVVAGKFYPSDAGQCAAAAAALLRSGLNSNQLTVNEPAGTQPTGDRSVRPEAPRVLAGVDCIGAIVPHAGWVCSGAIAGQSIAALAGLTVADNGAVASRWPDVVVVFGAIHTPIPAPCGMLCSAEVWAEPGKSSPVHVELDSKLREKHGLFAVDDRFHQREHAIEVELPLIQSAWPGVSILPVEIPPADQAPEIGRQVARQVSAAGLRAVFLASSDLTHYGPSYRFAPAGIGPDGLAWAKENDRRLLELVREMAVDRIVAHVRAHANACGGGAIAAMLAACQEAGATSSRLLRHASSFETLAGVSPQPPIDAVGYASVLVG